jgi:hypothetical protein
MGQDAAPDRPDEVEAGRPGGRGDEAGGLRWTRETTWAVW